MPADVFVPIGKRIISETEDGLHAIANHACGQGANGEEFVRRGMRWITDKDTGEKSRQEVPVRFRRWWWNDDTGKLMMEVRYGNKPLELQPGKPTIEVGKQDNLVPVLNAVREAVAAGELDKLLMVAKKARPRPKRKGARS